MNARSIFPIQIFLEDKLTCGAVWRGVHLLCFFCKIFLYVTSNTGMVMGTVRKSECDFLREIMNPLKTVKIMRGETRTNKWLNEWTEDPLTSIYSLLLFSLRLTFYFPLTSLLLLFTLIKNTWPSHSPLFFSSHYLLITAISCCELQLSVIKSNSFGEIN